MSTQTQQTATLLQVDGEINMLEIKPANGIDFTLAELQKLVGGYIEVLALPDGRILIINEDDKGLNLKPNTWATRIARMAGIAEGDWVVGPAVLCEGGMLK